MSVKHIPEDDQIYCLCCGNCYHCEGEGDVCALSKDWNVVCMHPDCLALEDGCATLVPCPKCKGKGHRDNVEPDSVDSN